MAPAALVASAWKSPGTERLGGVVSTTVTVKDVWICWFWPEVTSVAVQVTVVTPSGNVLPEAGAQTTVGAPSWSVAEGLVYVYVAPAPEVASTVALAGIVPATQAGGSATALGVAKTRSVVTLAVSAKQADPSRWPPRRRIGIHDATRACEGLLAIRLDDEARRLLASGW